MGDLNTGHPLGVKIAVKYHPFPYPHFGYNSNYGKGIEGAYHRDPNKDSWNSLVAHGDFPPHYGHSALAINGKIYVVGGVENNINFADSIWVFDPSDRSWSLSLPVEETNFISRYDMATSVIRDNIYTIGGSAGTLWWISPVEV